MCLLLFTYLIQKSNSPAPAEQVVHAVSWVHAIAIREDPTQHPLVQQTLAGAKCLLSKATDKKEPITASILQKLVNTFGGENAPLADVRTLAICLISFAGFLRCNELAKLKESDLAFFEDHLELYIASSKTDQYRDGAWVVVARTRTELCPVQMLERYMALASIGEDADKFLFRGILNTKLGARLRPLGGLSYTKNKRQDAARMGWGCAKATVTKRKFLFNIAFSLNDTSIALYQSSPLSLWPQTHR